MIRVLRDWVLAAVLLGLAHPAWGEHESGHRLVVAVVSRDLASRLEEAGTREMVVISDWQTLVRLPAERLASTLGAGRPTVAEGVTLLPVRDEVPVWITPGQVPPEVERETGVAVLYRTAVSTLFQADREAAYRLLGKGYFVVEVSFKPAWEPDRAYAGRRLAERMLAERPLTEARRDFVEGLTDSVSSDSLRRSVYFLNYDAERGVYRSRFATRYDLKQQVVPWARALFEVYLGEAGGTVIEQEFQPELPQGYKGQDSVLVNIVATKPGRLTSAHYIICAHYDATASRESGWEWREDPAPGADDNASGVAGLVECARLVSAMDLDVGVKFVAFSCEELGLLGSSWYASQLADEDSIIGVINLDMIGYRASGPKTEISYDYRSGWLSDLLAGTDSLLGLPLDVQTLDRSGVYRSDHGSFSIVGIPAVMVADETRPDRDPLYPYYHTLGDTMGGVSIDLVRDNVKLVVGLLARFASEAGAADLHLTEGGVEWKWRGRGYRPLVAGDTLTAIVRAANEGGSMALPVSYRFEVWKGARREGSLLHASNRALLVPAGGRTEVAAAWATDPDEYPSVAFTIVLEPTAAGVEEDLTDNQVAASVRVMPRSPVIHALHVYPNPVSRSSNASLSFEVLLPRSHFTGRLVVSIFDLEGRKVGEGTLVRSLVGVPDFDIGRNAVSLGRFLAGGSDLPPGLYVCVAELGLTGEAGSVAARSKFAVAP